MNVNDMTAQQAADWCAEDDGWQPPGSPVVRRDGTTCTIGAWTRRIRDGHYDHNGYEYASGSRGIEVPKHPHPLTLDGAAAALPEGWTWEKSADDGEPEWSWGNKTWRAFHPRYSWVGVPDTGDEIADRYRLAVLCRLAAKEQA